MSSESGFALRRGDRVGVVAPGFAVRPDALDAGLAQVEALGGSVVLGDHVRDVDGYFAGPDADRAADLNRFLRDPGISGIWFARGGYGAARLIRSVDWRAARTRPRVVVGYSDNTALFLAASRRGVPWTCLHGPVVSELGDPSAWHAPSLRAALRGESVVLRYSKGQVLAPGRVRGPIVGGNLTVLVHLLGTPDLPSFAGSILLLEDVGEEAYRIDRMLDHLRRSGRLRGISAVVVGSLEAPATKRGFPPDRPALEVLAEALAPLRIPVVRGLPLGHLRGKRTIPLGVPAVLDTARGTLTVRSRGPAA